MTSLARRAPQVLGAIRLFYGTTALVAPGVLARRLGADPAANPAAIHPLRMFGIRTVLIGVELLAGDDATRRRSMTLAPLVHATDTASAVAGGLRNELPPRAAALAAGISGLNTVLAVAAWAQRDG